MSVQEQQWLQETATEATIYQRKLWQAAEQEALEAVKEAGVEIIIPDKALFSEKTKSLFDAYKDQPEKYALIRQIQAVQ